MKSYIGHLSFSELQSIHPWQLSSIKENICSQEAQLVQVSTIEGQTHYREVLAQVLHHSLFHVLISSCSVPGQTSLRPPSYAGSEDESNGSSTSSRTPR